jgi:hypothetical protein
VRIGLRLDEEQCMQKSSGAPRHPLQRTGWE